MKRLPTSGFRPALITFFSLLLLLGCEKDGFAPFDTPDEIGDYSPSVNYPISIWEAMTYYGHLNSFPPTSS
ncbi:MAG: hypothetical protein KIS77_13195 [Saprospiraceae bacterium]|nr:hypothetical protein [Saprospiraceae bacterium]